ncbi:hypothetical protein CRG98_042127 [Punica granatum]|uniref:Uncharacterized protein n=1 Tax=Punica granatum TaxID=22663 RepID=A0A2I0I0I0_PUNGR|nr:hypothetical protein CRG98_042127 [Punica granatum]
MGLPPPLLPHFLSGSLPLVVLYLLAKLASDRGESDGEVLVFAARGGAACAGLDREGGGEKRETMG